MSVGVSGFRFKAKVLIFGLLVSAALFIAFQLTFPASALQRLRSGELLIEIDCRFLDSELLTINLYPGKFCKYDNSKGQVLVGSDESICLFSSNKLVKWCHKANQLNHDIAFNLKNGVSYILDYELSDVSGELEGYSVLKAYDGEGGELFSWSTASLYKSFLDSEYRDLVRNNYISREVRVDGSERPLRILINNIQFLEDTAFRDLFDEKNRYLLLSFANLNHLAIFDTREFKVLRRFKLFKEGGGGFFHMPQVLSPNEVLIFRNIILKNPQHSSKPLLEVGWKDFYSDACIIKLDSPGTAINCWLEEINIAAPIMGSAQLIEDHLFVSYCGHSDLKENKSCHLVLIGPKREFLWVSSQVEKKFSLELLKETDVYRAQLVERQERASFLKQSR